MTISNAPEVSESGMLNGNINDNSNDFPTDVRSLFESSQMQSTTPVFPAMNQSQAATSCSLPLEFRNTTPIESQGPTTTSCPEYTNNDMYDLLMNNILGSVASFKCSPGDAVECTQSTSDPNNNNLAQWNIDLG